MFLLLTILYVLHQTLAAPIPSPISEDHTRAASNCAGNNCRSVWNIVWSCTVTIFACTWVAVHPNVPTAERNAHRRWYSCLLRRARITMYALIGPEFVLIWAWRQRVGASRTSEVLKDRSRVHGFLAVMGGFVDGDEVLSFKRIEELVRNEEIEYPIVSREEIEDRSKGDAITKALVVLQTAWFLLQCAARASQRLPLTELELATAAFAFLNIIMYVLWWHKPLDVECPIRVRRREHGNDEASKEQDRAREESDASAWNWRSCFRSWGVVLDAIRPFLAMMGFAKDDAFSVVGGWYEDKAPLYVTIGGTLVTVVFGGIHCIGWSFDFPSHTEQLLWRISSISITGIPLCWVLVVIMPVILGRNQLGTVHEYLSVTRKRTGILVIPLSLLYIVSRVLLLVVSLATLRSLPSSAFQTVEWTTFLPHV